MNVGRPTSSPPVLVIGMTSLGIDPGVFMVEASPRN